MFYLLGVSYLLLAISLTIFAIDVYKKIDVSDRDSFDRYSRAVNSLLEATAILREINTKPIVTPRHSPKSVAKKNRVKQYKKIKKQLKGLS